ncbi:MAG TPA: ROK family transcriptional regulator, partial [Mycobacterium sp.]|nr:ROK family transcriptional regulator [Mycobacterium sp.]
RRVTDAPRATDGPADSPASLRTLGRIRVLEALNQWGRLSRPDLTRRTGLARATVGSVIADLIAAGIVTDHGTSHPGQIQRTGRPARTIGLLPTAAYAVGLDIGHDHVRCMLCDLGGEPVTDRSVELAVDREPDQTLACATELVAEAIAGMPRERILGLGVGIASPINPRTGMLRGEAIMPGWVGLRVDDELAHRTGLTVRSTNDANAGVLGERRYGAARDCADVIYIRLSSGIGAGVVCDGRMLLGSAGLAGEIGHLPVVEAGTICRCGNRGCLETVASPAAIAELLQPSLGRTVAVDELLELTRHDHRGAIRAVQDAGDAVGRALAFTVTLLNPQLIVVGGELEAAGEALFTPMRRAIERYAMRPHAANLQIVAGALGDSACVRGAAALILAQAPERLATLSG